MVLNSNIMIGAGIFMMILGFILLIVSCFTDDDYMKTIAGVFSGYIISLGLVAILPPMKGYKNEGFDVTTHSKPEIKKEIFIDSNGKADTTYYYTFENATVIK